MKKNLIRCKHAEKLGEGGRVRLGNLLISGRKTLILRKAVGGGEQRDQPGFKEKEKVMSRVLIVAAGTSVFVPH